MPWRLTHRIMAMPPSVSVAFANLFLLPEFGFVDYKVRIVDLYVLCGFCYGQAIVLVVDYILVLSP